MWGIRVPKSALQCAQASRKWQKTIPRSLQDGPLDLKNKGKLRGFVCFWFPHVLVTKRLKKRLTDAAKPHPLNVPRSPSGLIGHSDRGLIGHYDRGLIGHSDRSCCGLPDPPPKNPRRSQDCFKGIQRCPKTVPTRPKAASRRP